MLPQYVLFKGSVVHPLGTMGTSGSMVWSRERVGGGVRGEQASLGSGLAGREYEGSVRITGSHQ